MAMAAFANGGAEWGLKGMWRVSKPAGDGRIGGGGDQGRADGRAAAFATVRAG